MQESRREPFVSEKPGPRTYRVYHQGAEELRVAVSWLNLKPDRAYNPPLLPPDLVRSTSLEVSFSEVSQFAADDALERRLEPE